MFVFSNLATSLDGKIGLADRSHFPIGTSEDRKHMQVLRKQCDIVIFGAATLRSFQRPCGIRDGSRKIWNGVISRNLEGFSPDWPFFTSPDIDRILFVQEDTPADRLRPYEASSKIVKLKKSGEPTAHQILNSLQQFQGISRVLVEGGGAVMWDFASQDLIDEYHVTLTPRILGGAEAPTLVDGLGLTKEQVINLKLNQCRQVGDELYLIYKKTGRHGP